MAKGRDKYKTKTVGRQRQFSTKEDVLHGITSNLTYPEAVHYEADGVEYAEGSDEEASSGEESEQKKNKGVEGIIEIQNPNLVKQKKAIKARDIDIGKTTELSRREREELEKQRSHERYMKMQEEGRTEEARKVLERLALVRNQREEAAKRREEEKAAKQKKVVQPRKPIPKK